jgi:hypothetical protein
MDQETFYIFFIYFFSRYFIQHCFICRPSDSTASEDAGIEMRLQHWLSDGSGTLPHIIFCWHLTKRARSGAGSASVSQRYGSEDPHPDPYQNVMDQKPFFYYFFIFFSVLYSTLLHLPPLRFHCVGGRSDRNGTTALPVRRIRKTATHIIFFVFYRQ